MAKTTKTKLQETTAISGGKVVEPEKAKLAPQKSITLTAAMSKASAWQRFDVWLVGDAPMISHAWSEKAKREMLAKMVKAVKVAREERNPEEEFVNSLYEISDGVFGFPITAVKKAILSYAHKDRGIAKTVVMSALWLDYRIVSQRPALAGAVCDMPLVRIYAEAPKMREDMVRIKGRGGATANFAFRAQFFPWAIKLTGKIDPEQLPPEVVAFLVEGSGRACGIGDWRTEKSGVFGSYHMADEIEARAWDKYAEGKGPIPMPPDLMQAAAE
jgi:hypothetical protein